MKTYDLLETKEILKLKSVETVRRYIRLKKLNASKIGRKYVVTEEDIKQFLNSKSYHGDNNEGIK